MASSTWLNEFTGHNQARVQGVIPFIGDSLVTARAFDNVAANWIILYTVPASTICIVQHVILAVSKVAVAGAYSIGIYSAVPALQGYLAYMSTDTDKVEHQSVTFPFGVTLLPGWSLQMYGGHAIDRAGIMNGFLVDETFFDEV